MFEDIHGGGSDIHVYDFVLSYKGSTCGPNRFLLDVVRLPFLFKGICLVDIAVFEHDRTGNRFDDPSFFHLLNISSNGHFSDVEILGEILKGDTAMALNDLYDFL